MGKMRKGEIKAAYIYIEYKCYGQVPLGLPISYWVADFLRTLRVNFRGHFLGEFLWTFLVNFHGHFFNSNEKSYTLIKQ